MIGRASLGRKTCATAGKRRMSPRITILTATVGHRHLGRAVRSVQAQTFTQVEHLVVVDGPDHRGKVDEQLAGIDTSRVAFRRVDLLEPTGPGGFCGHRIYAAFAFLTNAPLLCFLDDDNWFEPDHLESLVRAATDARAGWAFALRNIVDGEGNPITRDECESLGNLHPIFAHDDVYHVDTNCYLIARELFLPYAAMFARPIHTRGKLSPDCELANRLLRNHPAPATNARYTVNYTVANTAASATAAQFTVGNGMLKKRYPAGLPWLAAGFRPRPLYVSDSRPAPLAGDLTMLPVVRR